MTEYPFIKKRIDIGWNYSSVQFAKIVMIPVLRPNDPFPPKILLQLNKNKGEFGFMNTKCTEYNKYENKVFYLIDHVIEDNTIIIMSEFGFTKQLEEKVSKKLINKKKKCIIVGGSYYFKNENNKIESRCPIILPNGQIEYQLKFHPSPKEKDKGQNEGFDPPDLKEIIIFQNSGFGDFAILICFDALNVDLMNKINNYLRSSIDYLIVIARNTSSDLPNMLRKISHDERWIILYCNGEIINSTKKTDCNIFSPYHETTQKEVVIKESNYYKIDFPKHQEFIAEDTNLRKSARTSGFKTAPRHGIFSSGKPLIFPRHLKVLAIGSHFDDIWLGCSATLMLLRECYQAQIICRCLCLNYPHPYFHIYSFQGNKFGDLRQGMNELCSGLTFDKTYFFDKPTDNPLIDRAFSWDGLAQIFKDLSKDYSDADLVFIPRQDDLNNDHALTAKAASYYFSHTNLFQYEIKEYNNNPFKPNILVDVSRKSNKELTLQLPMKSPKIISDFCFAEKKAEILEKAFEDIMPDLPKIFSKESCLSRMIFRANESSKEKDIKYIEAFSSELII